jgi:hypothetical protein
MPFWFRLSCEVLLILEGCPFYAGAGARQGDVDEVQERTKHEEACDRRDARTRRDHVCRKNHAYPSSASHTRLTRIYI